MLMKLHFFLSIQSSSTVFEIMEVTEAYGWIELDIMIFDVYMTLTPVDISLNKFMDVSTQFPLHWHSGQRTGRSWKLTTKVFIHSFLRLRMMLMRKVWMK